MRAQSAIHSCGPTVIVGEANAPNAVLVEQEEGSIEVAHLSQRQAVGVEFGLPSHLCIRTAPKWRLVWWGWHKEKGASTWDGTPQAMTQGTLSAGPMTGDLQATTAVVTSRVFSFNYESCRCKHAEDFHR